MSDNYKIDSEVLQSLPSGLTELICKLARQASLGMLSNRLMHDFRNKLAVISGNIQIIQIKGTNISPEVLSSRLAIAMRMIEETLILFDDIGSSSDRAAGIVVKISTEKAIKRTLAVYKQKLGTVGIKLNEYVVSSDFSFKGDAGLFDYMLMSLIEMFLYEDRVDGKFKVSSAILKNTWQMSMKLHLRENDNRFRENFRKRINSPEMLMIKAGVEVLKGRLKVLEEPETYGFELEI